MRRSKPPLADRMRAWSKRRLGAGHKGDVIDDACVAPQRNAMGAWDTYGVIDSNNCTRGYCSLAVAMGDARVEAKT
jgi:hypothetical protein